MKTLIIYSSRYGLTSEAASELATRLGDMADLVKITKDVNPDPENYEQIIVGSSIYMSQADKNIRQWVQEHKTCLLSKQLGFYLCCGLPENFDSYLEQAYGKDLVNHAVTACLGGELRTDRMRWIDRRIAGMMTRVAKKEGKALPEFHPEQIMEFGRQFG